MRFGLSLFLLWSLALPAPALAQAPREPTEAQIEEAKRLSEEAARYYDLGQYGEALRRFEQAYLLSGAAALLVNIGQCYRFLERYDEARRSYEAYLRAEPQGEYRPEVERLIEKLKELDAQRRGVGAETPGVVRGAAPPPATRPVDRGAGVSPKALYIAAAASAGAGLLFGGGALAAAQAANEVFPDDEAESQQRFRVARGLGVACDVALVAALAAGGAGLFVARRSRGEPGRALTLAPAPGGASLALRF
jgi:tetratricopeptide (TPR) repeat protein